MAALALTLAPSGSITSGSSDDANFVADQLSKTIDELRESISLNFGLRENRQNLRQVFEECRSTGWDGYSAEPIAWQTYANANAFLQALPSAIPMPTIGAEPDGHITLEWYSSPRRVLSVSVSPEGDLHYAALLGGVSRQSGTESFLGDVPEEILRLIRRLCPK